MSVVSRSAFLLVAAVLTSAAAADQVAKPQYRVAQEKGATVVTIFAGEKPTGGYSVVITGIQRKDGACTVRYRIEEPGPDMIVTQALTYPSASKRIAPPCRDAKVDPPLPRGPVE